MKFPIITNQIIS